MQRLSDCTPNLPVEWPHCIHELYADQRFMTVLHVVAHTWTTGPHFVLIRYQSASDSHQRIQTVLLDSWLMPAYVLFSHGRPMPKFARDSTINNNINKVY